MCKPGNLTRIITTFTHRTSAPILPPGITPLGDLNQGMARSFMGQRYIVFLKMHIVSN